MFEYPLIDKMNNTGADIMLLISPRNCRKSTQIQLYFVDRFINYGEKFLILRRKIDETISETWLSEYARKQLEKNDLELTSKNIDRYIVEFRINGDVCGYGAYCSVASKYKSNDYGGNIDIKNAVLEEAIAENELETSRRFRLMNKLLSVVSTLCRSGQPKIYMLGNDCENGQHSQLITDFNLTNCFLNINEVQSGCYKYLDKNYSVSYLYFTDDLKKCEWLNSCKNVEKLNLKEYNATLLHYLFIYNDVKYFAYVINSKFVYISSEKEQNNLYYSELEFLEKTLGERLTEALKTGINNPKTREYFANLLRLRYYELRDAYNYKNEYIPQKIENFNIDDFKKVNFDTYYNLKTVDKFNTDFDRAISDFMTQLDNYNNKIIFDNPAIMLKFEQEEIILKRGLTLQ